MGCGRSKPETKADFKTPPIITSIDDSKDGITFNENGENIVVRYKQPTNIPADATIYSTGLVNVEKQTAYSLNSSTQLEESPKRVKLVYKGCGVQIYNKGFCGPIIGDNYVFQYDYGDQKINALVIKRKCDTNTSSEITYRNNHGEFFTNYNSLEGFTDKCSLLPNEYAIYK